VIVSRQFDVIIERDAEGYFVASVPGLPGCHTQARSLDELHERVREAIALYLEERGEAPDEDALEYVGIQRVSAGLGYLGSRGRMSSGHLSTRASRSFVPGGVTRSSDTPTVAPPSSQSTLEKRSGRDFSGRSSAMSN